MQIIDPMETDNKNSFFKYFILCDLNESLKDSTYVYKDSTKHSGISFQDDGFHVAIPLLSKAD